MCVTRGNFKYVLSTCRLTGWLCGHSQPSSLLQTSKLLEKTTDGNVPHVRRLNVFKIYVKMTFVNMTCKFAVTIEHQDSLFVLGNPRLQ